MKLLNLSLTLNNTCLRCSLTCDYPDSSSAKKENGTKREVSSKMLKMVKSCLSFSLLLVLGLVPLHSCSLLVK